MGATNCASVSSTRARGRPNQTPRVRALARPLPSRPPLVRRAQIGPHHFYMQALRAHAHAGAAKLVVLEAVCGRAIPDSGPLSSTRPTGPFSFLVPSVVPSDQIFALDGDNDFRYHDFRLVAPLSRFWGGHSPGWSR